VPNTVNKFSDILLDETRCIHHPSHSMGVVVPELSFVHVPIGEVDGQCSRAATCACDKGVGALIVRRIDRVRSHALTAARKGQALIALTGGSEIDGATGQSGGDLAPAIIAAAVIAATVITAAVIATVVTTRGDLPEVGEGAAAALAAAGGEGVSPRGGAGEIQDVSHLVIGGSTDGGHHQDQLSGVITLLGPFEGAVANGVGGTGFKLSERVPGNRKVDVTRLPIFRQSDSTVGKAGGSKAGRLPASIIVIVIIVVPTATGHQGCDGNDS